MESITLNTHSDESGIIASIIKRMDGFLYRCRNNKDYSMIFMVGDVLELTGVDPARFIGAESCSYAGMTHKDDLEKVYAAVDIALEGRSNWTVDYRICRADGSVVWVREIGGGVYQGNDLLYLEGLVINSDLTRRAELANMEMLAAISDKARLLMVNTVPIVEVLRTLRILGINARLEAGRAGSAGAAFGFVAQEMSRLANETSILAERIASVTGQLQELLKADEGQDQ